MIRAQELSYGRVRGGCRKGTRLGAYETKYGGEIRQCASCGDSIVLSGVDNRDLCRSLYGVEELPAVCVECLDKLREEWLAFMQGRTLFPVIRRSREAIDDKLSPEMIS